MRVILNERLQLVRQYKNNMMSYTPVTTTLGQRSVIKSNAPGALTYALWQVSFGINTTIIQNINF